MTGSNAKQPQVKSRRVFYIPGFDPYPPRRYRELYRREGKRQGKISGYEIEIAPREGPRYGWYVGGRMEEAEVFTEVETLTWSDIVRDTMGASVAATYLQLLRVVWVYIASGTARRLFWLRKGPVLAGFYPVTALLLQLLVAFLAGSLLAVAVIAAVQGIAALVTGGTAAQGAGWQLAMTLAGWAITLPVMYGVLRWFRARDGKAYAWYLMHDLAFSTSGNGAYPKALEPRLAEFADAIAEALAGDADEVLVVGHSSGAQLAVTVLADLIRAGRVPQGGPVLSLLTLGQAIPMVSFLPKATRLRADLHYLSVRDEVTWVDVSAPGDGCSFALCDPVAVSGVAPVGQRWPLVISAAFSKTLSPEVWAAMRWRYFKRHFQYLCAFDQPSGYDYFRITAGPLTLGRRFADRKPSMNRIDVAASRYTDIAA